MKTAHKLTLAVFVTAILAICLPAVYAEQDPWTEDTESGPPRREVKLTDEKINEIMAELAANNPDKAERLEQLRKENPDTFNTVIARLAMNKEGRRDRRSREDRMMPGMPGGQMGRQTPGERVPSRDGKGGPGYGHEMIRQQETETLEWLERNDPNEAKELLKLKEENHKLYIRKMSSAVKKYRKIMETEKNNPALAAVLKEDLELKRQTSDLMKKIRGTTDDGEKQKLKGELEVLTGKRFDLIIKKKQLQYEDLLKKLEELKNSIKEREAEIETLKGKKADHIKERVEELINNTEKIRWE